MTELVGTKDCPLCAESIRAAAKVCPHCRHWQSKWSLQNPQVGATIWLAVMMIAIVGVGIFAEQLLGPGRSFASYQDQIAVRESQLSHRMGSSNLLVTVVGVVTNRSEFGWKEVTLEAQMFDDDGALIDVISHSSGYAGVTVGPHGQSGFKIEGRAAHEESSYASHKVSIRWAKDINDWP